MKTITTILGARPQFIKAATITRALREADGVRELLVHTGQHFDANMSDVFFEGLMGQAPDHNLHISGGTHGVMTGRMLEALDALLTETRPDMVLVYGDTNSTLAGALAASKMHIPVAHVEAGLRSFNMKMPEEVNRRLTDHCSDLLFTPTAVADENLANEGIHAARVHRVGDVMFDASLHFGARARAEGALHGELGLSDKGYVLSTIHRQENTDDQARLEAILKGLQLVAREMPVVLPLHPRTKGRIEAAGAGALLEGLTCTDPLGYLQMVELEQGAAVIATDSGGVQKEAFFHGVPCVTLRDETEWVELVEAGWNRLLSPDAGAETIAAEVHAAIGRTGADVRPYGEGDAAFRITKTIMGHLS